MHLLPFLLIVVFSVGLVGAGDRESLRDLFLESGGGLWPASVRTGWLDPFVPHCQWAMVTCGPGDRVVALKLSQVGLRSVPRSLANLTALASLNMDSNALTSLPDLSGLQALTQLSVYANALREVGPLPPKLEYLRIDTNQVRALPPLPGTLLNLVAHFNMIEELPAPLPGGLLTLEMRYNSLSRLPELPGSLTMLKVGYNVITALPALPPNLGYLSAYGNKLTALPTPLPSALISLYLNFNAITDLSGIERLPLLVNLECGYNDLQRLPPLGGLENLVKIDLSHNRLVEMPMFDKARGLERLLLNDNLIFFPLQQALTLMGPRHPELRILRLSNNPLGGSLSLESLIAADIDNVRPILLRMASLETLEIANVGLTGTIYFAMLDTLWPGLLFLDLSDNPELESIPLRQSGRRFQMLARGCTGIAPFIAGGLEPGGATPEGGVFTNLTVFSALPAASRVSNSRHSECDEGIMAGTHTRFPVFLGAEDLGYSPKFCSCMKGFFGSPARQCTPCRQVADSLRDSLSSVACEAGQLTASGAWIFASDLEGAGSLVSAVSCPRGGSSSPCLSASEGTYQCAEGYTGRVCSRCSPGWYRLGRSCRRCSTARTIFHPLLTTASFSILAWSRREVAAIAIMHGQLLALITRALSTPPPDSVQQLLSGFLSLSAFSLEGVECLGGDRIDQFNGPLLAACLLPVFCLVPAAIATLLAWREASGRRWAHLLSGWAVTFFWGLFFAAKNVFGVLACTDEFGPRGHLFVSDFLWLPCPVRAGPYRISYGLAFSCLTLFAFITVALLGVVVSRPERFPVVAGRLRHPFVPELWWWERVRVARKWTLAAIHGLSPFGSPTITIGYISVLTVSVLVQVAFRPFSDRKADAAELASLIILYGTFISWKLISDGEEPYVWSMALILAVSGIFIIGLCAWELTQAAKKVMKVVLKAK
jgi:Leucine-rich repeat (LRR) protein